jgi:hypothetical protein
VRFVVEHARSEPHAVFARSVHYMLLAGIVLCGWQLARSLIAATDKREGDVAFHDARIATAHAYATHVLPRAMTLEAAIVAGLYVDGVAALHEEQF